jgi:hypothetical protein
MTYKDFIAKYNGKGIDYDGVAGVQCVDLAKQYLHDVFGISPGAWGDAHAYYDNFNSIPALKNNFTRIANTADFVPKQGDIVVWSSALSSGGWGHIAIATGEGDTTYFYSYDQNWTGKHDVCTKIKHTYKCVLGVLRPKNQTSATAKATTSTVTKSTATAFKAGTYTLTTNVNVRTGAGKSYRLKQRSELTADGKKNALMQNDACLKTGTKVTVSLVERKSNSEYWGKIPSGWICLMYGGAKYVK